MKIRYTVPALSTDHDSSPTPRPDLQDSVKVSVGSESYPYRPSKTFQPGERERSVRTHETHTREVVLSV